MSAFSIGETVLLSNENLGTGEMEVFDPENGAFCDHDFRGSSTLQWKEAWNHASDPRWVTGHPCDLENILSFIFSSRKADYESTLNGSYEYNRISVLSYFYSSI